MTHISEVKCWDIEVFSSLRLPLISRWPLAYSWMADKWPSLYNMLFRLTDSYWACSNISRLLYAVAKPRMRRVLEEFGPDILVSTAPFVAEVTAHMRSSLKADFLIANVISDLVTPHASWVCPEADVTIACSPLAKRRLVKHGQQEQQVIVTSLPVQKEFYEAPSDKMACRRQQELDSDRFTILLSGGSLGVGPVFPAAKALVAAFPEAQLLITCGYNKRLHSILRSYAELEHARIYDFTDQMPRLLQASDVFVSKGGPSSIMEAAAAERPVVVIAEVGRQEKGNGDLAQQLGIGYKADSLEDMVEMVRSLMLSGSTTDKLSKPDSHDGSYEAARFILDVLKRRLGAVS
jgi:1,2-diacylglycerol 3-beta-galactosyltransferase